MTLLDPPLEYRLRGIEDRLTGVEQQLADIRVDIAAIKAKLDNVPGMWVVWVFLFSTTIPIYGILVTLLWNSTHH